MNIENGGQDLEKVTRKGKGSRETRGGRREREAPPPPGGSNNERNR